MGEDGGVEKMCGGVRRGLQRCGEVCRVWGEVREGGGRRGGVVWGSGGVRGGVEESSGKMSGSTLGCGTLFPLSQHPHTSPLPTLFHTP